MSCSGFIKLFLTLVAVVVISVSSPVHAADVVSVQSISIPPYDDAFKGIEQSCGCDVKQFVLSEMKHLDVTAMVRGERPDLVVAIGPGALKEVRAIRDIPIVYLMVLDSQSAISEQENVRGINMIIDPSRQVQIIHQALPEVRNIGIIYHPDLTGRFVFSAAAAARSAGLTIITEEARKPGDVAARLRRMTGEIDALWMVPDVGVITPETVEILFLYSLKHKVPVITFSRKYLETGALLSLDVDALDIGRQAGEMVKIIVSGTDIKTIENQKVRKINITVNQMIARKLGMSVSDEILKKAKVINGE